MSISNAITLPRPDVVADAPRPSSRLRRSSSALRERQPTRTRDRGLFVASFSLVLIVGASLLIVLAATAHPSLLAADSRPDYFPRWMAGPLGGLWSSLTTDPTVLRWGVSLAMIAMYAGYALSIKYIPRVRTRWVVASIVAAQAIYFLAPPMMLTDIFNYINYGRMEIVHHLNPYTSVPALESHLDPSFALSNWHHLSSPYGPLFTILTFAVVPLGVAGSFWALKAFLLFCSLTTVLLVWKSAQLLGRNPTRAIFTLGMNPIVLMWGLGGDHNDFVMLLLLMLGIYLLLRSAHARGLTDWDRLAPRSIGAFPRSWLALPAGIRDLQSVRTRTRASAHQLATVALDAPERRVHANGNGQLANGNGHLLNGTGQHNANGNGHHASASEHLLSPAQGRRRWLPASPLGPFALEVAAGACLVAAVAIKASAAVVLPVVLVGLARHPRLLLRVLLGVVLGALALGACTLIAFGPHIPALEAQASLVTEFSLPNLLGLALGQGGATNTLRAILDVGLLLAVASCAAYAWRRGDYITAAGWASVALITTLSWSLPWYILWVLPLAALSGSRRLRRATLVLGAYLIAIWIPVSSSVVGTLGLHPSKTAVGEIHHRQVSTLMRN